MSCDRGDREMSYRFHPVSSRGVVVGSDHDHVEPGQDRLLDYDASPHAKQMVMDDG